VSLKSVLTHVWIRGPWTHSEDTLQVEPEE
jgi:hypothetical protein